MILFCFPWLLVFVHFHRASLCSLRTISFAMFGIWNMQRNKLSRFLWESEARSFSSLMSSCSGKEGSTVDPVEGNVRAAHCCCNNTHTHLHVSGVNWSGVFCLGSQPTFHSFRAVPTSRHSLPLYRAKQLERCLLSYPKGFIRTALTLWKHYNYWSVTLNMYD